MSEDMIFCGCGDELKTDEDKSTGVCWICRSIGRMKDEKKESAKEIAERLGMTAEQVKMLIELEEAH